MLRHEQAEIARALMEGGADVNFVDLRAKFTQLYEISIVPITSILSESGADVEAADRRCEAPVRYDAKFGDGHRLFVQFLLNHGHHVISKDHEGQKSLEQTVDDSNNLRADAVIDLVVSLNK